MIGANVIDGLRRREKRFRDENKENILHIICPMILVRRNICIYRPVTYSKYFNGGGLRKLLLQSKTRGPHISLI